MIQGRRMKRVLIVLSTAFVIGGAASQAEAHLYESRYNWYLYGSTYRDRPPTASNRSDPVNLIFYRGRGHKSPSRVGAHISKDWRYGTMRDDCAGDQYMVWRDMHGNRDSDKTDMQRVTGCGTRYHIRGWDDYEHWKLRNDHGDIYQWVIGNVHHERDNGSGHTIDRDWDSVRVSAVKAMSAHCSYRRWRYHPGADRTYQGFTNAGYLARISMRHVADGCSGA
jgi:hypothetical protein